MMMMCFVCFDMRYMILHLHKYLCSMDTHHIELSSSEGRLNSNSQQTLLLAMVSWRQQSFFYIVYGNHPRKHPQELQFLSLYASLLQCEYLVEQLGSQHRSYISWEVVAWLLEELGCLRKSRLKMHERERVSRGILIIWFTTNEINSRENNLL